jgi:hypothetical protein
MSSVTNDQLRRLLLGQLGPDERERLEEATLMQDGFAERLREEEFDLVDDYVAGRLAAADRNDFEKNFLITPERSLAVRVARAFAAQRDVTQADSSSRKPSSYRRTGRFQTFATAAGLLAVACTAYWGMSINRPGGSATPGSLDVPASADTRASFSRPTDPPMQAPLSFQTITLLADANRGGSRPLLHLEPGNSTVRLQLEVPEQQGTALYSVELGSPSQGHLFFVSDLPMQRAGAYGFVELTVPAEALGPGARTITLRLAGSSEPEPPEYRWQIDSVQAGGVQKK